MREEADPGSSKSVASQRSQMRRDFEMLVGEEVYATWIAMLKRLGPGGRTHRLSVVVAGMLYYAWGQDGDADNAVRRIIEEAEGADYRETEALLIPLVEQLFKDAGVSWKRKNSKGQGYSIAEESIREFFNWDLMPWE
jgi:hypothetical protein